MSANDNILIDETYGANLEAAALARRKLKQVLAGKSVDEKTLQDLLLVTSEWMANLVKHSSDKSPKIQLIVRDNRIQMSLEIIDQGAEFLEFNDHMSELDAAPFEVELKEGGLGLRLIKHAFPHHSYEGASVSEDNCNHFKVFFKSQTVRAKQLRIAVIDDDASMRTLLEAYLSSLYEVNSFADGKSALEFLSSNMVDLVISDIRMPGMDGMEFRRQLSARPETDIIPFIFLTSSEDDEVQDEAADLGVDDYLSKPITKARLLNVTKRLLKRAQHLRKNVGLQLEENVTQKLAPSLPAELKGFKAAVRTISPETGGGDFLTHIESGDDVKIFFGDVMGHGLQAKFFAHAHVGYLNGILRSIRRSRDIATLLAKFSDAISDDDLLESTTLTCVGITLKAEGVVQVANAAHPKPWLIQNQHQDVSAFSDVGALLGLIPGNEYAVTTLQLKPGERLLVYTDGFIEIGHSPTERAENETRIPELVRGLSSTTLDEFADKLSADFMTRCGAKPQDDMTLVVLEYQG